MSKKFLLTLELEIPDSVDKNWNDEYILSGIELVPQVCSFSFEGIKLSILNIQRADGTSLEGYPSTKDVKEFVFFDRNGYNMAMVEKSRLSTLRKMYQGGVNGGLDGSAEKPN